MIGSLIYLPWGAGVYNNVLQVAHSISQFGMLRLNCYFFLLPDSSGDNPLPTPQCCSTSLDILWEPSAWRPLLTTPQYYQLAHLTAPTSTTESLSLLTSSTVCRCAPHVYDCSESLSNTLVFSVHYCFIYNSNFEELLLISYALSNH